MQGSGAWRCVTVRRVEGDGWVNWSGLATLLDEVAGAPDVVLARLRLSPGVGALFDEAYEVRRLVTVAPVTTRVCSIPVEVPLGPKDGMPRECVANLDTVTTIPKDALRERLTVLSRSKMTAVDTALRFGLGLQR